jgi:predicted aconitase with swiveling domain
MTLRGQVLIAGDPVDAESIALTAPISFWGGVNPRTGEVADVRHPQYGQSLSGKIVLIPATVGSSSAAAVLLELVHAGRAPAAIVLHEPDAILLLGLIVANEMGERSPIALRLDREHFQALAGRRLVVSKDGDIETCA